MSMLQCPVCNKFIAPDASFCPKCGKTFQPGEVAAGQAKLRAESIKAGKGFDKGCVWLILILAVLFGMCALINKCTRDPKREFEQQREDMLRDRSINR